MQSRKTVLLADDDSQSLMALTRRCMELGVNIKTAADGLDVLMLTAREAPDLIVLDMALPGVDGPAICEKLSQDVSTAGIPVIILTSKSDDDTRNRCKLLGAHYVHKDSDLWDHLKPMICDCLGLVPARPDQPNEKHPEEKHEAPPHLPDEPSAPKVLVIDDDPYFTKALRIRLGTLGIEVIRAPNARIGAHQIWTLSPDLIITDQNMPEMSGKNLIAQLKGHEKTKNIPVVMITGQTMDGHEDWGLKSEMLDRRGAVAYLTKPVDYNQLIDVLRRYIKLPSLLFGRPASAARR